MLFVAFHPQSLSECEDSNYTEFADDTAGFIGMVLFGDSNENILFNYFIFSKKLILLFFLYTHLRIIIIQQRPRRTTAAPKPGAEGRAQRWTNQSPTAWRPSRSHNNSSLPGEQTLQSRPARGHMGEQGRRSKISRCWRSQDNPHIEGEGEVVVPWLRLSVLSGERAHRRGRCFR